MGSGTPCQPPASSGPVKESSEQAAAPWQLDGTQASGLRRATRDEQQPRRLHPMIPSCPEVWPSHHLDAAWLGVTVLLPRTGSSQALEPRVGAVEVEEDDRCRVER